MPQHFFIIGAQRSGSTLLRHLMDQHPDVEMAVPVRPEPKHFLDVGSEHTDPSGYRKKWFVHGDSAVLGEKSTSYIDHPESAHRIKSVFPDARIMVALRSPVERALSHYRFTVDHGLEPLPVHEALTDAAEGRDWDRSVISVSPFRYISRGDYWKHLTPWYELFGTVHVVIFERMVGATDEIAAAYRSVGVDDSFHPEYPREPVNPSSPPVDLPDPATLLRLRARYEEPNARLANLIGRDLADW